MAAITRSCGCVAGVLAALLCVAGPAHAQRPPWRHGIQAVKSEAGFVTMVRNGGFAEKQGLQIELPVFQSDVLALRALLAGGIDSYEGGPGTAIVAASKGADVKIMGCSWLTVVHSVFATSGITSAQDLRGKVFAISAPGAMPDLVARTYLAQNRVPDASVRFASLGDDGERYKALLAGVASASVMSIEFLSIAEHAGIHLVERGSDIAPKFLRVCTMSTGRLLASRRADAVHFMAAEMQALTYALANRTKEIELTREVTGAKPDDPRPDFMFEEASRAGTGVDPTMPIPLDKLDWMQNELIKVGNMREPYDLKKIVDEDIRAEALGRAGPH